MTDTLLALKKWFGLGAFRKGQAEILESILRGHDVLAVLPTGGGKSLCYQLPALIKNELVIVVSPLIALMRDQVLQLRSKGLQAGCLHSGQDDQEKREIFYQIKQGGAYILYLSPERVQKEGFRVWVQQQKIALFAIDEAHCVSQWGHDFRPEYAQLNLLKALCPEVPVLALTASATPLVLHDIARTLKLKKPVRHVHGFYRPNLYFQVESCLDDEIKIETIRRGLRQFAKGKVLIYCGTRKNTEMVAASLEKEFSGVSFYHAGMSSLERNRAQATYSSGQSRILVATNAFGMGIDHPDVRWVVHYNLPSSLDALYQEMGRGGRDGQPSTCTMLYSSKDKGLQSYFIQSSEASEEIKRSRWSLLGALVDYAESHECRHAEILTYYQDSQRIKACGHCDICLPNSDRRVLLATSSKKVKLKKSNRPKVEVKFSSDESEVRFMMLRDWRKQKSQELDVPAFVIMSDRTLRDLASTQIFSSEDLSPIHGMGPVKIERFGADILRILNSATGI